MLKWRGHADQFIRLMARRAALPSLLSFRRSWNLAVPRLVQASLLKTRIHIADNPGRIIDILHRAK